MIYLRVDIQRGTRRARPCARCKNSRFSIERYWHTKKSSIRGHRDQRASMQVQFLRRIPRGWISPGTKISRGRFRLERISKRTGDREILQNIDVTTTRISAEEFATIHTRNVTGQGHRIYEFRAGNREPSVICSILSKRQTDPVSFPRQLIYNANAFENARLNSPSV